MKRKKRRLFWMDIFVAVAAVALVALGIGVAVRSAGRGADRSSACEQVGAVHETHVADEAFTPGTLTVKRCDTVKIVNLDTANAYELVFGASREAHAEYPGYKMTLVRPNEYFMLDAVQAGSYTLHDHLRDRATLELEVE